MYMKYFLKNNLKEEKKKSFNLNFNQYWTYLKLFIFLFWYFEDNQSIGIICSTYLLFQQSVTIFFLL